jgi:A/G-specific adenine glycosylase
MEDRAFVRLVMAHFRKHGRHDLPWRRAITPYRVLVSELMLQQTQVPRVTPKFREFIRAFPSFRALAQAPVADVLRAWQGLGYNRRAIMLQRCAQAVVREHRGRLPTAHEALTALPGIGPYTAGAVMAFAFDQPHPVIETNIRRVYLHHFFPGRDSVPDSEIMPLVERHVRSVRSPRQWYGALMDYGTHLAQRGTGIANPNRRSRHYARQARFQGSLRQLRGRILRLLLEEGSMRVPRLAQAVGDRRAPAALAALVDEGMVRRRGAVVEL